MVLAGLVAVVVALAAGCGGGGGSSAESESASRQVSGTGFVFSAPADWQVARTARGATTRPDSGPALTSVTVLALRRRYRPALFARVARGLDRITTALAAQLKGKVVARRSVKVGGIRSRQYDVAYKRTGSDLIDRITYVLRGKSEYYLLCRWPAGDPPPPACAQLTSTFRIR